MHSCHYTGWFCFSFCEMHENIHTVNNRRYYHCVVVGIAAAVIIVVIGKHMLCTHRHHFNANSLDCSTFNYIIVNTLIKNRFHLCGAYSLFIFIQRNLLFYVITCKSTGWMVFLVFVCACTNCTEVLSLRFDSQWPGFDCSSLKLYGYFAKSHCQMFTAITIGNNSNITGVGGELIEWENIIN